MQDNKNISIKLLEESDILAIVDAFKKVDWEKPKSLLETYYKEQQHSYRVVWVAAYSKGELAGYITLNGFPNINLLRITRSLK